MHIYQKHKKQRSLLFMSLIFIPVYNCIVIDRQIDLVLLHIGAVRT